MIFPPLCTYSAFPPLVDLFSLLSMSDPPIVQQNPTTSSLCQTFASVVLPSLLDHSHQQTNAPSYIITILKRLFSCDPMFTIPSHICVPSHFCVPAYSEHPPPPKVLSIVRVIIFSVLLLRSTHQRSRSNCISLSCPR